MPAGHPERKRRTSAEEPILSFKMNRKFFIFACFILLVCLKSSTSQEFTTINDQRVFEIGGFEQRVRLFMSDQQKLLELVHDKPQMRKIESDPLKRQQVYSVFGAFSHSPGETNLREFSNGSLASGYIINPHFFICFSKLLELVKTVGDRHSELFKSFEIREVNLFLLPVARIDQSAQSEQYKIALSDGAEVVKPNPQVSIGNSLNIQIPYNVASLECGLPEENVLDQELQKLKK